MTSSVVRHRVRRLTLLGIVAAALAAPTAARADGARTAHLEIYNGGTITEAQCRVFGKQRAGKKSSLLDTIDHKGHGNTGSYTVEVPAEFDVVAYHCRATKASSGAVSQRYGKVEQELERQPLDRQGGKASCSSSDKASTCSMSVIGIDSGDGL